MKVLDKKNFETEVLQSEGTMLVDFFSEGCEPCQALMPSIEEFAENMERNYHLQN